MKRCLVLVLLSLGASMAFAQQPAPVARGRVAAPPPAQVPLPAGAKYAFVNIQAIIATSAEGKADNAKVEALVKRKQAEAQAPANQKTPQAAQRFQEDAQAEVQKLQGELQADFQRKLMPVLQQLALEKHLSMLFGADAGLLWAEPGLDLTAEAIKRFDAATARK